MTRTLSATVYAALVVSAILVNKYYFGAVFMVLSMLTIREFMHLRKAGVAQICMAMLMAGVLFAAYWMDGGLSTWSLICYNGLLIVSLVWELFAKAEDPIKKWGDVLISQAMIALPFAMMAAICTFNQWIMLALVVMIWINDSGAYIIGSLMGKRQGGNHKMFPRVSPNKSWEGLIGGVVVALIGGVVLYYAGWFEAVCGWHALRFAIVMAALVSVFGTLGDLMESLLKRTIGVKDSGNIMPGHGGALDRFDSLLLASPVVYLLLIYWQPLLCSLQRVIG